MQQIYFETINFHGVIFEYSNHILSSEIVETHWQLVGSEIGNGRHHGESRSTPHVEVELSFPSQTRGGSALWFLRHVLGLGQDFKILLSAQMVGELLAPMCSRWGSNLNCHWTMNRGFLLWIFLATIRSAWQKPTTSGFRSQNWRSREIAAVIIALRRPTTFFHLYSRLNCVEVMALEIPLVFND